MSLPVSTTWKNAIESQFRYPAYLRVMLRLEPPEIPESATITSSVTETITSTEGLLNPSTDTIEAAVTFESSRWKGDGSMYLLSEDVSQNKTLEWWSNIAPSTNPATLKYYDEYFLSSNTFQNKTLSELYESNSSPVDLLIQFNDTFTFAGLTITWDVETSSWPSKVKFIGIKENNTTEEIEVIPSEVSEFYAHDWVDIKAITIRIMSWPNNWRARIQEIIFGRILKYTNSNISSAEVVNRATILANELPTYTFKFNLYNYDKSFDPNLKTGIARYLAARQKIVYQWGFETSYSRIEWMNKLPIYLNAWSIPYDSSEVSVSSTGRLAFLQQLLVKSTYTGQSRTMYDIALEALQNSDIIIESNEVAPWELSEDLKNWTTLAPVPLLETNAILQYISNYTGCVLDTNPLNGYVRFRNNFDNDEYTIGMAQQLGDPAYTLQDQVKSLTISIHTYRADSNSETVYSLRTVLKATRTLTCRYSTDKTITDPTTVISGGTIISATYYAHAAILVVAPTNTTSEVSITINGKQITDDVTYFVAYENSEVDNGLDLNVNNPFITDTDQALKCASNILKYYKNRMHMEIPYLGYPEITPKDIVTISDTYGSNLGYIEEANLTFNGGFNGTLKTVIKETEDASQNRLD